MVNLNMAAQPDLTSLNPTSQTPATISHSSPSIPYTQSILLLLLLPKPRERLIIKCHCKNNVVHQESQCIEWASRFSGLLWDDEKLTAEPCKPKRPEY